MSIRKLAKHLGNVKRTKQTEPVPNRPDQVENNAGGFVFAVDDWTRLERFLILGTEGGTYYVNERKLTKDNAAVVTRCLDLDPVKTVNKIVEISVQGRAPKNDQAILALAIAASHKSDLARKHALDAVSKVCRIGTHLFQFAEAVNGMRGWGAGVRKAMSRWYNEPGADRLAYQVAKYQDREGWRHKHVLLKARVDSQDPATKAVLRWAVTGAAGLGERDVSRRIKGDKSNVVKRHYASVAADLPAFLAAVDEARTAAPPRLLQLIREHNLPREVIPTERLNDVEVWEALLERMPLNALVRNLGKMTSIGLIKPMSDAARLVAHKLTRAEYIRQSRLHPMSVLLAAKTYGLGHGLKGKLTWLPVNTVSDALDVAFHLAFGNVVPSGKRTLIAVDVSGSMESSVAGSPISCREAAAAMALVTARTEPLNQIVAFSENAPGNVGGKWQSGGDAKLVPIDLSACSRVRDAVEITSRIPMGGTDCSLPMRVAEAKKWDVDTFVVLTDNETWAGPVHPFQAIRSYRDKSGIPAKLVVVGMTADEFSIADPTDAGMLDVVGLDASTPGVIADFSRGSGAGLLPVDVE